MQTDGRIFVPRKYQEMMIDHMQRLPRCNVFASPGAGKTASTLAALDILSLVDDNVFPALVVGPKRVVNQVWSDEVDDWAQFQGLRVSKMLGTKNQRHDALFKPADIYTINPANLQWLDAQGYWPFKTVVCDESTLIKNHRVHFQKTRTGKTAMYVTGAKGPRALVKHAKDVKRWINLTGTPTPNGLEDLWGQQWPIDFGAALGPTHSFFMQTYFRPAWGSSEEHRKMELLPGAKDRILDRIAPTSLVVDAYDWFDISRPIVNDMMVRLPAGAMAAYRKMHADSVLELADMLDGGVEVTAVNAGSMVMKCRQIASGHIRDDAGVWHTVHDAKLDALDELRESLNGQPLLVAYWFKADAAAIQARFKDAVLLPNNSSQKEVTSKWNNGKVKMLLVHPQSAGHGLNLQHGGNHLCFYTVDWNAEYYEQVIERIGPTRQAQGGYNRPTFVHRLIADNTWEKLVAAAVEGKITFSNAVKAALTFTF